MYTPTTAKQSNAPGIPQVDHQEHLILHHKDPQKYFSPIFNLLLYITLIIMFLTWPAIQYPIKTKYIIGIWSTNCMIPPTGVELMVVQRLTKELNNYL